MFPGNDLVGVMLPDGVPPDRFLGQPGRAGDRAGRDDETLAIASELDIGTEVVKVVDLARGTRARGQGGKGGCVGSSSTARASTATSSSPRVEGSLRTRLAQAGARVEYDDTLGVFVPTSSRRGWRRSEA